MAPISGPRFSKKLHCHVDQVASWIKASFESLGYTVKYSIENPENRDIRFCQQYHSKNELIIDQNKITGITIKRVKQHFLIQGIIHLQKTATFFSHIPELYKSGFATGVSELKDINAFIDTIQTNSVF